jgi:hypothetical protein
VDDDFKNASAETVDFSKRALLFHIWKAEDNAEGVHHRRDPRIEI